MKRVLCLLAALLLALPCALADQQKLDRLPEALLFTQRQTNRENVYDKCYTTRMYPETCSPAVNQEMAGLIDAMHARALPHLPKELGQRGDPNYITTGANITRTGDRWLSFLTIARVDHDRRQTYVDFDARVYDMITGSRVTLADVFPQDSPAWDLLADAVREQLTAYFLGTDPDAEALDALCTREALMNTPFTLTPVTLRLHYRADVLYPGREQLMHVKLFYAPLRDMMTETAYQQTDNSMYKMVALTFDDGVSHYDTNAVYDRVRQTGAAVTFFVVGKTINENQDMLAANHDAGHLVASHNYQHVYEGLDPEKLLAWKDRYDQEMNAAIGIRPIMMRAPGGIEAPYARARVGLPVIHWSVNPSDAGSDKVEQIIRYVSNGARNGDIVLMHDLNKYARNYAPEIVKNLTAKGFLCVTVEELFAANGKTMVPNTVYYGHDDVLN